MGMVLVPEAGGGVFNELEEGEVVEGPPRDPAPLFVCVEPSREECLRVLVWHGGTLHFYYGLIVVVISTKIRI
jgi:hypothetical protein